MYPRIPWKLVADPLRRAEHILGTTGLKGLEKRKKNFCGCREINKYISVRYWFRNKKVLPTSDYEHDSKIVCYYYMKLKEKERKIQWQNND